MFQRKITRTTYCVNRNLNKNLDIFKSKKNMPVYLPKRKKSFPQHEYEMFLYIHIILWGTALFFIQIRKYRENCYDCITY